MYVCIGKYFAISPLSFTLFCTIKLMEKDTVNLCNNYKCYHRNKIKNLPIKLL